MLRIAVSLAFAVSLAAQPQRIVLDPPGPTSLTPIMAHLYVACDPVAYSRERLGNVIKIHVTSGLTENLCDPPIALRYPVSVGTLPAVSTCRSHSLATTTTFTVTTTPKWMPQAWEGGRGNVEITMPLEAFRWAFAAVTNNDTQQVAIVAPQ